jgi:hypothetical protein
MRAKISPIVMRPIIRNATIPNAKSKIIGARARLVSI